MFSEADNKVRFDRVLDHLDDPSLVLLKGHLLVEEILDEYLFRIFTDKKEYKKSRLTFYQKYTLVMAHVDCSGWNDPDDEDLQLVKTTFHFVEKLNQFRNKIAHRAENPEFEIEFRASLGEPVFPDDFAREIKGHVMYLYYYLRGFSEGTHID